MQITIHRGTHQIGGCVTEIKTNNTRIFIDLGAELPGNISVNPDKNFEIEGLTTGEPNCDALFITHTHGDHIGLCGKVLPGIPVYCGKIAKEIYVCLQKRLKDHAGDPDLARSFKTFSPGEELAIGDMVITAIRTDHSAYDAYMFVVEGDGKKVLHTGDFRDHGQTGKGVAKALPAYCGKVDVLITEGTMFGRPDEKVMTELELQKEAKAIIEKEKYCFVMCSSTNIDRIAAFYHAAKDAGRMVLCDAYQKDVLDIVTRTRHSDYYDFTGVLVNDPNNKAQQAKLFKDGAVFIVRSGNWRNYKGFFEKKNGLLVYSMWHGYLHGGAKNSQLAKIVESTGTRHIKLHTSGHATVEALEKVISLTNPDMIIPIHSEKPERMNGIDHGTSTIQYLVDGENLEL